MRRTLAILALLPLPLAAQETQVLACATPDGERIDVTLWSPSESGPLHCVAAAALEGLFACAPDGGWGLTDPAAPGRALTLATDSREVQGRDAPKFYARVGPSQFVASASRGTRIPLTLEVDGETFWRLQVTLETGEGWVETPGGGEVPVACERP